jgi:hypothetical protein
MKPLESYYAKNPILARAQARKLYRHLKAAAIEILQEEMKQTKGRDKVIGILINGGIKKAKMFLPKEKS